MAGCFEDSDCANVTEVTTATGRKYQVNVETNPQGPVICGPNGLALDLQFPVPVAVTADQECRDGLRLGTDGKLYSIDFPAVVGTHQGTHRSIPGTGAESGSSHTGITITNPNDCKALLVIHGKFEINWAIADTPVVPVLNPNVVLHNANFRAQFLLNATARISQYAPVGGATLDINAVQFKKWWNFFSFAFEMAASQVVTVSDQASHQGADQILNVDLTSVQPAVDPGRGQERGFRSNFQYVIYPMHTIGTLGVI